MKNLLAVIIIILICSSLFAQENLFERNVHGSTVSQKTVEKINRFKMREGITKWEYIALKKSVTFSKNYKGVFNIFDNNLEFEIKEDYSNNTKKEFGYRANLKEGGYALLSISSEGICASIWYKDKFYSIESVENGIYFVTESDLKEIAKNENPNDYGVITKLKKTNSQTAIVSAQAPAVVKVLVAYTPAVAQAYNIKQLITQCLNVTNQAYQYSLVSTRIDTASTLLNYTESGYDSADVYKFMNNGDGIMDQIHTLRIQKHADICVLLVNTLNSNGRVPNNAIPAVYSNAFCVVKASAAASNYSFAHEIGHLLGCRHEKKGDDNYTLFNGNIYGFCHGYARDWTIRGVYGDYKTIMAVSSGASGGRIPYFSNPRKTDDLGVPLGTVDLNDCSRLIDIIAPTVATFEPDYASSGTITWDETWSGEIIITGNVTIASGYTLTINPNTIVKFPLGTNLTVNGKLIANNVTFTSTSGTTPGSWGGIQISSSSVGSSLTGCTIKHANIGISSSTSSVVLQSNTIQNNNYGISLSYSPTTTLIKDNYITSNAVYGIFGTHAYGRLEGNQVFYNTQKGIYFVEGSRPAVYNNEIQNNGTGGIAYYNNCVIGGSFGAQNQYNKIINNNNSGLYAELNCDITFGISPSSGNNTIAGNWVYNARAVNNTDIIAENNFWNGEFSSISADATSTIDYTPYRTTTPPPAPGAPGQSVLLSSNGDDPQKISG